MIRALIILLALACSQALAVDRNAASCSRDDVNTAMQAAQSGDRVIIPAGTCNWTTTISWSPPANVQVLGAGNNTIGGGDLTIIQDNVSGGSPLISISTNASGYFRFGGITIRGGTGSIKESGMLLVGGSSQQVLLDRIHINKTTYSPGNAGKAVYIGGMIDGVCSRCRVTAGTQFTWFHMVNGDIGTSDDHGDTRWAEPTNFGSSDFFFIEDSIFEASFSGTNPPFATFTDCHTGGKFVVRFSTSVNMGIGQTHPTAHASNDRGCRAHEIYMNTSSWTGNPSTDTPPDALAYNNSGTALIWGNSFNQTYKRILYFNNCRVGRVSDDPGYCGYDAPYGGWNSCTGSSVWDENTSGQSGWRCVDQPGMGQGDLLTGTFGVGGGKINQALGVAGWPRQASEPIYEWNNTGTHVSGWGGGFVTNLDTTRIQQNRDYYLHRGNTGCDAGAGSCTTGVGVGTLAQRPANCTTGVAFWVTNEGNWNGRPGAAQGRLYKCTATNTWTQYYEPYKYPHPLAVRFLGPGGGS